MKVTKVLISLATSREYGNTVYTDDVGIIFPYSLLRTSKSQARQLLPGNKATPAVPSAGGAVVPFASQAWVLGFGFWVLGFGFWV